MMCPTCGKEFPYEPYLVNDKKYPQIENYCDGFDHRVTWTEIHYCTVCSKEVDALNGY